MDPHAHPVPTALAQHTGARACLVILIVLQAVMLAALFSRTEPHPPLAVPPFALGPFLGAALAVAAAAWAMGTTATRAGTLLAIAAALLALVSFGPQKLIDPAFPQIWPAVVLGQISAAILLWISIRGLLVGSK